MILIIDKSKSSARKFADSLYYAGMPTLAVTYSEAFSYISPAFCAIIVLSPDMLPDVQDYIKRIRCYAFNIPVFAVCTDFHSFELSRLFDGTFKSLYVSDLLDSIRDFCKNHGFKSPGDFRLAGIDVSLTQKDPTYLWSPISLTKTEKMILRVFIASYPKTLAPKEILTLAFKKSRIPELSNIRAHICIMNKKFREILGRNLFAVDQNGGGYQILTPEILEQRKKRAAVNNTSLL
jgi:DNA-binding response OmpR family regulator